MPSKKLENLPKNTELEKEPSSEVVLKFFRHSKKEKNPTKDDTEIRLTLEGKKLAFSQEGSADLKQSLAFGSPRKRAQETAALKMVAGEKSMTGEESLEDLKAILDKDIGYGSKVAVDSRLDFYLEPGLEFEKKAEEAYVEGRLMRFFVEESDDLAKEVGDDVSSTYSRSAKGIAEIMKKYLTVAANWDRIAEDTHKENKTLERFFSTHQSVPESFLAKVIEKIKGVEERNKFIDLINGQGFDFVDGYEVKILSYPDQETKILISYKKAREGQEPYVFEEEIDKGLLEEIIKEGK